METLVQAYGFIPVIGAIYAIAAAIVLLPCWWIGR